MIKKSLLILIIPILLSCSEENTATLLEKNLISSSFKLDFSKNEILSFLQLSGISGLESYFQYDIELHEITYETTYLGQSIEASGLVAFPKTSNAMPMLSFQHGTIASDNEAPTEDNTSSILSGLASTGYVFMIPDFIGFGISSDVLHPYYNKALSASVVLDMVTAVQQLASQEGYRLNNKLYLTGYSEGGYVTLAAHQSFESNPIEDIELIASAPAAGGYDIKGVQEYFFAQETYHQPFFLPYVYLSYVSTGEIDLVPKDLFNEPYATGILDLFDGSLSGSQINAQLTTNISELLTEEFLDELNTNPKYDGLNAAFEDNSIDDWVPEIPVILYHGNADITVPYQNSVDVYNQLLELGTNDENLEFITLEGYNHTTGITPYIEAMIKKFDSFK